MAKITIVLLDEDDESVNVSVSFEPELKKNEKLTPAQEFAFAMVSDAKAESQM